ncbi:MAG TPA: GNAT family N-acetyltransferase [Clostridia bacterium]|nr:GNAT family N-acetyltransferase [Clostridia bacterium]
MSTRRDVPCSTNSPPATVFASVGPRDRISSAFHCEFVTSFDELESISSDWARLVAAEASNSIFQTFGWFRAFWHAYGSNLTLQIPIVRDQRGCVAGILPMVASGRILQLPRGDYNDVICEESAAADVVEQTFIALLRTRDTWDTCELENVPASSRLARAVNKLPSQLRSHLQVVFRFPCPTILITENDKGALRKLAQKKDIRRQQHRLERLGRLEFRHLETREEIRHHLPIFFRQHIERRALLGQRSRFLEESAREFYQNITEEFDPAGPLRFSLLQLDGRPLAYHFGFQYNHSFIRYTSVFNVDEMVYSPGEVLLGKLLEYAEESDICEFDFGIGGEDYKRRFSNHTKENVAVYLNKQSGHLSFPYLRRRAIDTLRWIKEQGKQQTYASRRTPGLLHRIQHVAAAMNGDITSANWAEMLRSSVRSIAKYLYSKEEVAIFTFAEQTPQCDSAHPPLVLSPASLGELATVSLEHRELGGRLRHFADRLRRGHAAYIYHPSPHVTLIAWAAKQAFEITAPEEDPICRVSLDKPAIVLYDVWSSSGQTFHIRELFGALSREATSLGYGLQVVLQGALLSSQQNVNSAGLVLERWCTRTRILGRLQDSTRN